MIKALGEIASIRTATVFREAAPKAVENGNVRALAIKDIVAGWPIDPEKLPMILLEQDLLGACLRGGEVLIPSRGNHYPARYFDAIEGNSIFPFGQINIIEPRQAVSGQFLAWFLNQPHTQHQIVQLLTGSNIKALNKVNLLKLPISIPPVATQYFIAELQDIWIRKKSIQEKLLNVEAMEIEALCRDLSTGKLSLS